MREVEYEAYDFEHEFMNRFPVPEISHCPLCGCAGRPVYDGGVYVCKDDELPYSLLFFVLYCTSCKGNFIAVYRETEIGNSFMYTLPQSSSHQTFDKSIEEISPEFIEVYSQAKQAENANLDKVAGMGYRKALEALVKDYLISLNPENADKINTSFLGECIKQIPDSNIQDLAQGAAWLGNDETHRVRRHPEYNINHLKQFINAMAAYITLMSICQQARELVHSDSSEEQK